VPVAGGCWLAEEHEQPKTRAQIPEQLFAFGGSFQPWLQLEMQLGPETGGCNPMESGIFSDISMEYPAQLHRFAEPVFELSGSPADGASAAIAGELKVKHVPIHGAGSGLSGTLAQPRTIPEISPCRVA
jgi:hypothetical protein